MKSKRDEVRTPSILDEVDAAIAKNPDLYCGPWKSAAEARGRLIEELRAKDNARRLARDAEHAWTEDFGEVLCFARVLSEAGEFDTQKDLLYLFEKPWKWSNEHARWIDLGRPDEIDDVEVLRPEKCEDGDEDERESEASS